jgi:hypothetical protein
MSGCRTEILNGTAGVGGRNAYYSTATFGVRKKRKVCYCVLLCVTCWQTEVRKLSVQQDAGTEVRDRHRLCYNIHTVLEMEIQKCRYILKSETCIYHQKNGTLLI